MRCECRAFVVKNVFAVDSLQISQPFFLVGDHGIEHLLNPPVLLNDRVGQERLEVNPPGLLQNGLGGQAMDNDLVEQ